MASKKYLSLDEVAGRLGLSPDQVNKIREEGRLRGFADRGTWKFKADDVEEYARSRQAGSAPDVPILEDDSFIAQSGGSKIAVGSSAISADDDDTVGEQPTVIRGDATGSSILDEQPSLTTSDSDVRLILDDSLAPGDSNPDVAVQGDSDSDVRLIDPTARSARPSGDRSDSDVKLVADDEDTVSDVRLLSGDEIPADKSGSDSDVALVSQRLASALEDDDEDLRPLAGDSGIALESGIADSGIALDAPGGIRGGAADSGIALEDSVLAGPGGIESSIISLSEDSGIALSSDSAKGSGIQIGGPSDSGIALEALNEGGGATQPMMRTTGRGRDADETQFEMDAADSEFELASGEFASDNDTSVILFEEEDAFDAAPPKKAGGPKKPVQQFVASEADDVVELDEDFDAFDEGGSAVAIADEDEDLEFEAADEDFDEGFQTGESAADFAPAAQRVMVAPEPEISAGTFAGLAATSALLVLCGMLMFDLVRSMWGYNDPMMSSWLLESTKNLF
jgi:excisionase family DNA binding protein